MKTSNPLSDNRSGMTLFVVMAMTLLCAAAVSSVLFTVGAQMQRSYKQVYLEQAFYIAEAGMERAMAWVADGNEGEPEWADVEFGDGSYTAKVNWTYLVGHEDGIEIVSTGKVNGTERTVTVRGLRNVSWARYALWYDREALALNIAAGDTFRGRFYSRPMLRFSKPTAQRPHQARFYDRAWTVANKIDTSSGAKPIFDQGLVLNAEVQEISDVNLADLKTAAATSAGGLVLNGDATIELDGTVMRITNGPNEWENHEMPIPANGIVYASKHTYQKHVYNTRKGKWEWVDVTEPGSISVAAPNGLDGQITLVAERDINIVDHVRYADNPQVNPDSDDKLGLIAGKDAVVKPSAPNDVDIFAHIFCRDGGFGVEDYNIGKHRGTLNVYGGIANLIRNAVGIVNGAGYLKNYVYDPRFARNPPPYYPRLTDILEWEGWEG